MVEEINKPFWRCPYCDNQYDSYDEANDCATDCADVDNPIEDDITEYRCEMCNQKFDINSQAEDCEERHNDKRDIYYERYNEYLSKERLKEAAAHPDQSKITNFN